MLAIFGMPFFLAGVFMVLSAIGVVPMSTGGHDTPVILGPMGLMFLVVGGLMVFGRQWLVLDLGRGSILRQIGLLVPLRTEERPLSEFNAIVLAHQPGDSESAETYPVRLRAWAGKDIAIVKPLQFGESLRIAEYLAKTLRLQLIDSTTDRQTIVSPHLVGAALRDRIGAAPETAAPERPSAMHSQVVQSAAETKIVIPGGPKATLFIRVLLSVAIFLLAMLLTIPFLAKSANPIRLFMILVLIFGLPTAFSTISMIIASKRRKTTVSASASGLVIEQPRGRRIETVIIPVADVLDLDTSTVRTAIESARRSVDHGATPNPNEERVLLRVRKLLPNPGVVVKARSGLITFGEGLSENELQYLVWLLRRALTG